jgi:hypothetical protein
MSLLAQLRSTATAGTCRLPGGRHGLLLEPDRDNRGRGKNTFHLVGLDERGAIVLRQKVSHVADAPRQTGPSKPPSQGTPARAVKPGTKGGHKAHH